MNIAQHYGEFRPRGGWRPSARNRALGKLQNRAGTLPGTIHDTKAGAAASGTCLWPGRPAAPLCVLAAPEIHLEDPKQSKKLVEAPAAGWGKLAGAQRLTQVAPSDHASDPRISPAGQYLSY